jgi:hypothetical protein
MKLAIKLDSGQILTVEKEPTMSDFQYYEYAHFAAKRFHGEYRIIELNEHSFQAPTQPTPTQPAAAPTPIAIETPISENNQIELFDDNSMF